MRNFVGVLAVCSLFYLFAGCTKTVAMVNGQPITQRELDQKLEEANGKTVLDTLVGRKLVEQDAAKKQVMVSDQEVTKQLDELKKTLNLSNLSKNRLAIWRDDIRFNLLLQKAIMSGVSESKIKDYYEKNKDILSQVELDILVVGSEKQADAISDALRRGQEFSALASQFSLDAAGRQRGGYVGYVARGNLLQVSPALAQAAFSLKDGAVSPVIKTGKGYYILKVLNTKKSFSELRDIVERQMAADRAKTYLDNLRNKGKIDYKMEFAAQ